MESELLNRGRKKYVNLNKKFLQLVEDGTTWEELQPLIDEMKSLAIYLQDIPKNIELNIQPEATTTQETTDLQEEPV